MKITTKAALAGAGIYLAGTFAIFMNACRRMPDKKFPKKYLGASLEGALKPYENEIAAGRQWLQEQPYKDVWIDSFDGLRLHARFYEHPDARGVLVGFHGYRSSSVRDFASACSFYSDHGFSLLLPDQRASGQSEGRYITFGVKESRDARAWCEYAGQLCPDVPAVLAGISMGASTAMMAAELLPENVKAIISDCGFNTPWGQLAHVAKQNYGKAAVALVPGVDLWCRAVGGFGLLDEGSARSLSHSKLPVLFIHGVSDDLVPCKTSKKIRRACAGPTKGFYVLGAGHGMSYLVDTEGYRKAVSEFLDEYVLGGGPAESAGAEADAAAAAEAPEEA